MASLRSRPGTPGISRTTGSFGSAGNSVSSAGPGPAYSGPGPHGPGAPDPDPFDPVRFTRAASRSYQRAHRRFRDMFVDLYTAGLSLAVVLALTGPLLVYLRGRVVLAARNPGRTLADQQWLVLPQEVVLYGMVAAVLAGTAVVARRLGPVSVRRAEGRWWLPLPLARRPMVIRGIRCRALVTAIVAAVLYLLCSLVFVPGPETSVSDRLAGAAVFGLSAASMLLLAGLRQTGFHGAAARSPVHAVIIAAAAAALAGLPALTAAGQYWPVAGAALAAGGLWLGLRARLELIPGAELVRGGAVSGHAGAAVYFMDINELTRALSAPGDAPPSTRGRRFYARRAAGPVGALIRADAVAFLRTPGQLAAPAAALAAAAVVVLLETGLPVYLQLAVLGVAGCVAASGVGAVARRTALLRGVDLLLPLPGPVVRASRMLLPAAVLGAWAAVLGAALALVGAVDVGIVGVAALAGIGLGAAAVRGGYREAPDWSVPPPDSPFGPVPAAQLADLVRGFDTAALSLVPFLLALFLGQSSGLLLIQAAAAGSAVLVTLLSGRR